MSNASNRCIIRVNVDIECTERTNATKGQEDQITGAGQSDRRDKMFGNRAAAERNAPAKQTSAEQTAGRATAVESIYRKIEDEDFAYLEQEARSLESDPKRFSLRTEY